MTTREFTARLMPQSLIRFTAISRPSLTKFLNYLIIASPVIFQVLMVSAQSFQPGYNPFRDTISSMVWGSFGWLQTFNFILFGALMIGLIKGVSTRIVRDVRTKIGIGLLYMVGAGFIILGVCATQSPGGPMTLQAGIHGITVYAITFSFPAAIFLLSHALKNLVNSKPMFVYTIITGTIGTGLIGLGIYLNIVEAHWFGMLERLLLLNGFAWLEIVSIYSNKNEFESVKIIEND